MVQDLNRKRSEVEAQLREQGEKQQRASQMVKRLQRIVRMKLGLNPDDTAVEAPEEKDLRVANTRGTTKAMLQDVYNLALQFPDSGIMQLFEGNGIKLNTPSLASSVTSSRTSSRAASMKSGGSARSGISATSSRSGQIRTVQLGI